MYIIFDAGLFKNLTWFVSHKSQRRFIGMKPNSTSTWQDVKNPPSFGPLQEDITSDVVIIGGGITGILCAYAFSKAGLKTVLLERDTISAGATAYTTAFITQVIDTDFSDLLKGYGEKVATGVWKAGGKAITDIEQIITQEHIDCDFMRCPDYLYASTPRELKGLEKEAKALRQASLPAQLHVGKGLGFERAGYIEFPAQAKFHPLKFVYGVAKAAQGYGANIYENSEVLSVKKEFENVVAFTLNHKVTAKDVVIASYNPFNNPEKLRFKKAMYVSYIMEAHIPAGKLKEGIYEDTKNPYQYFRIDRMGEYDRMIIGGQDHRQDINVPEEKNYHALENYLATVVPRNEYNIIRKWNGPILESVDGLPFIGSYAPHGYVATAFSGNGMTYAAIAANILCDLLTGRENEYAAIFDPKRKMSLKRFYIKGRDFSQELIFGALKNMMRH